MNKYKLGPGLGTVLLLVICLEIQARDFYVAPGGSDSNQGTLQSPLATLEAARDAVRQEIAGGMKGDITVHLSAGNYFVEKPLVIDDRDSGRDGHAITYKGAPDLGTRIYGGRRITGWQKLGDREYVAEVADLQAHFTLYENETAANGGLFHEFHGMPEGNWRREGTRLIYTPRKLPIEEQVIVLGTAKDVFRIEGRSMQQIAQDIVFDGLYLIGSDFAPGWKKGACYSTVWDGEYDGRPWKNGNLGDNVLAPDMRHGQFYVENARGIVIRNSKLYGAGFMAAMYNRWAQENTVENCWIENIGCNGLFFMGWECGRGPFNSAAESYVNRKNTIRNNVFYDIGRFAFDGGGIYMSWSGDNLVEHNIFHGMHHYGVVMKGWNPAAINELYSVNRELNLKPGEKIRSYGMDDIKLYGDYVVTEENQGSAVNHSRNNIVRYNDLSQIPRGGDDMGMIAMWCAGTNNVWNYNACHDGVNTASWQHWMHVLFNDDGSHGATLEGNIIYWVTGGIRSRAIMCKGNDQRTVNNIIADCSLSAAATIGPYTLQAHNMIWSGNIIASDLQELWTGGHGNEKVGDKVYPILKEADRNLYYFEPYGPADHSPKDEQRLKGQLDGQKRGGRLEQNSVYAGPGFVRRNPWWATDYSDYRLKSDSPALALGFKETDTEKIGVLRDKYPFDLKRIFSHPAGELWEAANYSRVYDCRISGQQITPVRSRALPKGSWVRYDDVDFGSGGLGSFRARVGWEQPLQTFEKDVDGQKFAAVEKHDVWIPHPYWDVSPVYKVDGKTGPELFDVEFEPETKQDSVKWKNIISTLKSRQTVEYPLGVMNLDVANGEENANSAAYMRSSFYARGGGATDIEIRGEHGVKLWVNGTQVFAQLGNVNQSKRVRVTFKQGWNTMMIKVVQNDKPWQAYKDNGNFWATVNIYYAALGGAFIVPGLPGREVFIDPDSGAAVEVRLDAPDGKKIGALNFKQETCIIEKTIGRHSVFLVFPNENVQTVDWFRFE